jgi:hypothetical protein
MNYRTTLVAAVIAVLLLGFGAVDPVQAGTCEPVKAKGVAKTVALATVYAQADLQQTAKSMKGRVTQSTTNCEPLGAEFKCKISAVVCPK